MIEIKTKLRKWGNSFGIVVPLKSIEKEKVAEGDDITVLLKKENGNVLKETFGMHKFSRSIKRLMKETDKELYNE